jgi:hypothetical protein
MATGGRVGGGRACSRPSAFANLPGGGYDSVRMGVFDFFRRRRERESAIPGAGSESLTRQLKGDGKPIGQPIQQTPQGFDTLNTPTDLTSMLALFQQAFQSGNFQVTQGENQVIDLRGSGLREEIIGALQQHGIDPDAAPGAQLNAGDVPGLQEQIMQALENAGVDVSQLGDGAGGITIEGSGTDSGGGGGGGE